MPAGSAGAKGNTGNVGPTGPTGPKGGNGTNGSVGPTGPTGPRGATGATGSQGPKGDTGTNIVLVSCTKDSNRSGDGVLYYNTDKTVGPGLYLLQFDSTTALSKIAAINNCSVYISYHDNNGKIRNASFNEYRGAARGVYYAAIYTGSTWTIIGAS